MAKQKYPPPRSIAIDVDGTLFVNGMLNTRLRDWCKEKKGLGFYLLLWSSRGKEYACMAADKAEMADVFDDIIGKPGYIVDDKGWNWIKYTQVVRVVGDISSDCRQSDDSSIFKMSADTFEVR